MTRFYSLAWFVSELADRFQKTGSRVAARDDTVCGLVGVVSGLYAVMWLEKTGSRLKPPHRIVTDPARIPVGRDDTVFGAGVVCFGAGWLILYGAMASAATLNLRRNLLRRQDFFQSIGTESILGKQKMGITGRCPHVSEGILCRVCRLFVSSDNIPILSSANHSNLLSYCAERT